MADNRIILYVDDEYINLTLFEHKFGNKYHILTAENASKGIDLLNKFPDIRIVISDMKMPQVTGIEFTIMAKEKFPELDYFIVTGYEVNDEIRRAIDSGLIKSCFCKPFNWIEISTAIEKALSA